MTNLYLDRRLYILRNTIGKTLNLNLKSKINLYELLLKPIWDLWDSASGGGSTPYSGVLPKKLALVKFKWFNQKYLDSSQMPLRMSSMTLFTLTFIYFLLEKLQINTTKHFTNKSITTPIVISELSSNSLTGNTIRKLKRTWPRDFLVGE